MRRGTIGLVTNDLTDQSMGTAVRRLAPVVAMGVAAGFLVAELIIGFATLTSPLSLGVASDRENVPLMLVPIIAWFTGRHPPARLSGHLSRLRRRSLVDQSANW